MKVRVLSFCIVSCLALAGPVFLFIPALVIYILVYTGLEVLFLAACVDAYFGYGTTHPYFYTACTGLGLLVTHIVRPRLWVYNK